MPTTNTALEPLELSWTVLLTTYRRDGTEVGTPVNLAVDGDRAYFRTYDKAHKVGRLRRDARVTLAPSTIRGRATGEALVGSARLLEGAEADQARAGLGRRHPVFQGLVIPLAHRLARYRTLHYEVTFGAFAEGD